MTASMPNLAKIIEYHNTCYKAHGVFKCIFNVSDGTANFCYWLQTRTGGVAASLPSYIKKKVVGCSPDCISSFKCLSKSGARDFVNEKKKMQNANKELDCLCVFHLK